MAKVLTDANTFKVFNTGGVACDINVGITNPSNGRIAFVQNTGTGTNIFTINPDGTQLSQLTHNNISFDPSWSPSGTEIAFITLQEGYKSRLSIISSDGTNFRVAEPIISARSPDWSPDSTNIAFASPNEFGGQDIYIIKSDGSNLNLVTNANIEFYDHPIWVSDNELLVLGDMSGDISAEFGPSNTLYRLNLTENTLEELYFVGSFVSNLDVSPDGNNVIFDLGGGAFSALEIYDIANDTANRLFESYNTDGIYASNATWSPTGHEIIYLHQSHDTALQLGIYDLVSGITTLLDTPNPVENGVSWQSVSSQFNRGVCE